jgi:hypothetical protein
MSVPKLFYYGKKERFGILSDGGYVVANLDNDSPNSGYDCYISCGVSNEESFTRDFLARYNIPKEDCYAFDGTIHDYPWYYTTNIQFYRINIGPENTHETFNLHNILRKYRNVFVKMDIEGSEYPWIFSLPEDCLKNIRQLVIEYHGVLDDEYGNTKDMKSVCHEKMDLYHYAVHIHANNYGKVYENRIPHVIEVSYVRKTDVGELERSSETLPIPGLDYPNWRVVQDFDLTGLF